MTHNHRRRSRHGFTRSEVIVTLALVGIVAIFTVTYLRSISRRERLLRNVRAVQFLLISARSNAMKQKQQVVVFCDLKGRRIVSWAEELPHNYIQDAGEPTLEEYRVPPELFFRNAAAGEVADGPSAVQFDGYLGNSLLVDRIVFDEDGSLVPPRHPDCRLPGTPRRISVPVPAGSMDCTPANRCRGIFFSDRAAGDPSRQNAFRVSLDDPGPPRTVTVLKWLPASHGGNAGETDYVPAPWEWMD